MSLLLSSLKSFTKDYGIHRSSLRFGGGSSSGLQVTRKSSWRCETPCCCSGRHLLTFGQIGTEENCCHFRPKIVRVNTHSLRSGFDAGLYGKRIVSEYAM